MVEQILHNSINSKLQSIKEKHTPLANKPMNWTSILECINTHTHTHITYLK